MKTVQEIKEELIKNRKCTNIPLIFKEEIWKWMHEEFEGESIQIGNMMNSNEFGCCATVGSSSFQVYMTPKDYETYLMYV